LWGNKAGERNSGELHSLHTKFSFFSFTYTVVTLYWKCTIYYYTVTRAKYPFGLFRL